MIVAKLLLLLMLVFFAEATLFLLQDNRTFTGVHNCSCRGPVPSCIGVEDVVRDSCSCTGLTFNETLQATERALLNNTTSWKDNDRWTTVCCGRLGSEAAEVMLTNLLNFAIIENLTVSDCQRAASEDDREVLTLYGLVRLATRHVDTNSRRGINVTRTDLSNLTSTYDGHRVTFIERRVLRGRKKMKSFSHVISLDNIGEEETISRAIRRAPEKVMEKEDRTFMITPIYVVE